MSDYKVVEIFSSIDGEGIRAGSLATFIRFSGCNIRCSYCDTPYAFDGGTWMTADEILDSVKELGNWHVTLTGGEPLARNNLSPLIKKFVNSGFWINIETNGSLPIRDYLLDHVTITMDWKMPASGMEQTMLSRNLSHLREDDVLKMVCETSDLSYAEQFLKSHDLPCWIYFSPVFGKIEPSLLVDFLKRLQSEKIDTEKMRVQIQMHKVIWDPNQRGV